MFNFILELAKSVISGVILDFLNLKTNKKGSIRSEEQFYTQFNENHEYNVKNEKIAKETARINQMPYLFLNQGIITRIENGLSIPLTFENQGNGTAVEIELEYGKDAYGSPIIAANNGLYETDDRKTEKYVYIIGKYLFHNVIAPGREESCSLNLYFYKEDSYDNGDYKQLQAPDEYQDDLYFSIKYKDMYGNEYRQKYTVHFNSITGNPLKPVTARPELIDKD